MGSNFPHGFDTAFAKLLWPFVSYIVVGLHHSVKADKIVNVVDVDSSSVILSYRLSPLNAPPLEKGTPSYLSLQEILIIGNCHEQVCEQ